MAVVKAPRRVAVEHHDRLAGAFVEVAEGVAVAGEGVRRAIADGLVKREELCKFNQSISLRLFLQILASHNDETVEYIP